MNWRALTNAVMGTARNVMGEPVNLYRGNVSLAVNPAPYALRAIYEEATNYDETGAYGLANIENAKAMADFVYGDLTMAPKRGDVLTVLATSKQYIVFDVVDDGWARFRCLLEEPLE